MFDIQCDVPARYELMAKVLVLLGGLTAAVRHFHDITVCYVDNFTVTEVDSEDDMVTVSVTARYPNNAVAFESKWQYWESGDAESNFGWHTWGCMCYGRPDIAEYFLQLFKQFQAAVGSVPECDRVMYPDHDIGYRSIVDSVDASMLCLSFQNWEV